MPVEGRSLRVHGSNEIKRLDRIPQSVPERAVLFRLDVKNPVTIGILDQDIDELDGEIEILEAHQHAVFLAVLAPLVDLELAELPVLALHEEVVAQSSRGALPQDRHAAVH